MFRSMSRTAVVAVVALTLVLASVPAAQASPFGGPSLDTRAGWLDAALSWLSGLLSGQEAPSSQTFGSGFEAAISDDENTVQSGMCIDPAGNPRPCIDF